MKNLQHLILTILLIGCHISNAQEITRFLRSKNEKVDSNIVEIREVSKGLINNSYSESKSLKHYHQGNEIFLEVINFKMNSKTTVSSYYDEDGRIKAKTIKKYLDFKKNNYYKDSASYLYSGKELIVFKSFHNDSLENYGSIKLNIHGFPVELITYHPDSSMSQMEAAEYNFEENRGYIYTSKKLNEDPPNPAVMVLDLKKEQELLMTAKKFDQFNNIIEYKFPVCPTCPQFFKYKVKYKYDEKGNWVKRVQRSKGQKFKKMRIIKYK